MNREESRKEKKRLEQKLKGIKTRISKLQKEEWNTLQAIYLLRGECYRCWYTFTHYAPSTMKDDSCHCGAVERYLKEQAVRHE